MPLSRTNLGGIWYGEPCGRGADAVHTAFYRTAAGAEIDLLLEIPGHGLWAVEIKRGLSARPEKGFFAACEDVKPDKRFIVNSGRERYPVSEGVDAISPGEMAAILAAL